jgi:hypothetical protein
MRDSIDRALGIGLTATELRVFLALLKLIPLYDRVTDHVANAQVVAATRLDPRHVRRALGSLHAKGVIDRVPGKGKTASKITFIADQFDRDVTDPEGAEPAPSGGGGSRPEGGGGFEHPEGADFDIRGGAYAPASEVLPEVLPEVRESVVGFESLEILTERLLTKPTDALVDEMLGTLDLLDIDYEDVHYRLSVLADRGHTFAWPRLIEKALKPTLTVRTVPVVEKRLKRCNVCSEPTETMLRINDSTTGCQACWNAAYGMSA